MEGDRRAPAIGEVKWSVGVINLTYTLAVRLVRDNKQRRTRTAPGFADGSAPGVRYL